MISLEPLKPSLRAQTATGTLCPSAMPRSRSFESKRNQMRSLDQFAGEKLAALESAQLRRMPAVTNRSGVWAERDGRRLLSFSCNDYLNLSQHPAVVAAAIEATKRYGVGAGASRLVTGNHPLYAELEERLARLKGTEAACVFGSGYLANTGIIPALVGPDDLILIDELSHACLHAGAKLSGATTQLYRHADVDHGKRCWQLIATAKNVRSLPPTAYFRWTATPRRSLRCRSWRNVSMRGSSVMMRMDSAWWAAAAVPPSSTAPRRCRLKCRYKWERCPKRSEPMAAICAPLAPSWISCAPAHERSFTRRACRLGWSPLRSLRLR